MTEAEIDASIRRLLSPIPASAVVVDRVTDRHVLMMIAGGLIVILLSIIIGLLLTPRALPNWAENVFVSIATASALKLGDCINAVVALSSSKSVERLGTQLGNAMPTAPLLSMDPAPAATGKPDDPVHTVEETVK